jgi:endonuclease III
MSAPSRTAHFTRLHKILKKYYQPVAPDSGRSVLEHLLFGCLLENAPYAAAEEALAALEHTFFDWNEIRVSSVRELAEVIARLPEPSTAAHHVKRSLQSIFEATYSFDLEALRKLNLGPAVERLEKIEGTTPFAVAYVVQAALEGHSIPIDSGALSVLLLVDLISRQDAAAGVVPGLERAIAKNAGVEFGSLLHQFGADFVASPYTPSMHNILLEINPQIKDRLPRRRDARSSVLVPAAASPGSGREGKLKTAHRAPEPQEPAKGKAEAAAEARGQRAEGKGKADVKAKVRETPAESAQPPAAPTVEELAGPAKKKPAPAKKKPAATIVPMVPAAPVQTAPQKAVAHEEPGEPKDVAAAKKKPVAKKDKGSPKKPAEAAKSPGQPDPRPQDADTQGLSKRKPR